MASKKGTRQAPLRDMHTGGGPMRKIEDGVDGISIRSVPLYTPGGKGDACAPSPKAKRRVGP